MPGNCDVLDLIRDAMAQQLQVDYNVGSTDSLVLRAVRCRH